MNYDVLQSNNFNHIPIIVACIVQFQSIIHFIGFRERIDCPSVLAATLFILLRGALIICMLLRFGMPICS